MTTLDQRRVILVPCKMYERHRDVIHQGTISSSELSEIDQVINSLIQDIFTLGTEILTLNNVTNTKRPSTRTRDDDQRTVDEILRNACVSSDYNPVSVEETADGDMFVILNESLFTEDHPPTVLLRLLGDRLTSMSARLVSTVLGAQYTKYLHLVTNVT